MLRWLVAVLVAVTGTNVAAAAPLDLDAKQITFGPKHHFFGYIGHAGTIPWNQSGRYIVALRSEFQDHLPRPTEAADVVLLDTHHDYAVRVVDQTRAWNLQQGTMLYWNPEAPETQFFFNDRDPDTNHVFCVLFDITEGARGGRVREYRYEDTPFGNSGVAQGGGWFLGINYGRMARLRPVTGYPGAYDWTGEAKHPDDDGIFKVDVKTGEKQLIVSFAQLGDALREDHPRIDDTALFINHTLWNRDGDRIYFYARGNFRTPRKVDVPFTVNPDGTGLTRQPIHIGGHPEWATGHQMIGSTRTAQVLYDTDKQEIVHELGNRVIFPRPGGDIALSPDGKWLVNGYRRGHENFYVLYRMADGAFVRSSPFDVDPWVSGPLRLDPAPCWNRDSTALLIPALADDDERTRQSYILRIR